MGSWLHVQVGLEMREDAVKEEWMLRDGFKNGVGLGWDRKKMQILWMMLRLKIGIISRRGRNHRSRGEYGVGVVERPKLSKAEVADWGRTRGTRIAWVNEIKSWRPSLPDREAGVNTLSEQLALWECGLSNMHCLTLPIPGSPFGSQVRC